MGIGQNVISRWIRDSVADKHDGFPGRVYPSAVSGMARFDSAARGDRLYNAAIGIQCSLRTILLANYFVNAAFRREHAAHAQS